jgi:hypothetical protein
LYSTGLLTSSVITSTIRFSSTFDRTPSKKAFFNQKPIFSSKIDFGNGVMEKLTKQTNAPDMLQEQGAHQGAGGWARSIARKIVASTLRKGVRLFASTMPYKA